VHHLVRVGNGLTISGLRVVLVAHQPYDRRAKRAFVEFYRLVGAAIDMPASI
jgi:hypothetical protein